MVLKVDAFLKNSETKLEKKKEVHDFKSKVLSFYIELCKQIKFNKQWFDFNSLHLIFAANFIVQNALSTLCQLQSLQTCTHH